MICWQRSKRKSFFSRPRPLDPLDLEEKTRTQQQAFFKIYHLLAHAADVVVPDIVEPLLVLAPDRLPLTEDLRVRCHDRIRGRVGLHHFKLDRAHPSADQEGVSLADGPVGLQEVRLEERIEEIARDALDGVVDGEDVDLLAVLDVGALMVFFFEVERG